MVITERSRLTAVALAVALGAQAGCLSSTKTCTLIGCGPPFQVAFQPAGGQWSPGRYDVTVNADGMTGNCAVTLPFASCQSSPECTGTQWEVLESGCALPAEQHAISGVTFGTTLAHIEILINLDGRQLADATFTPTYQTSEPNGPGCGDTCYGAPAVTMAVQP